MGNSTVMLLSKPGCHAQLVHSDYTPDDLCEPWLDDDRVPLACVVALQPNTFFDVWPGATRFNVRDPFEYVRLCMGPGDVCIFRGDLAHAGASFEDSNVRVLTYMDTEGFERTKTTDDDGEVIEQTYYLNADTAPNLAPRN